MTAFSEVEHVLVPGRGEVGVLFVLGRLEVLVADAQAGRFSLFSKLLISATLPYHIRTATDVNHDLKSQVAMFISQIFQQIAS